MSVTMDKLKEGTIFRLNEKLYRVIRVDRDKNKKIRKVIATPYKDLE